MSMFSIDDKIRSVGEKKSCQYNSVLEIHLKRISCRFGYVTMTNEHKEQYEHFCDFLKASGSSEHSLFDVN